MVEMTVVANGIETFNPSLATCSCRQGAPYAGRRYRPFLLRIWLTDDALAHDEVFQSFSATETSVEDDVIELRATDRRNCWVQ